MDQKITKRQAPAPTAYNCNFCSASCNPCDFNCPLPTSYCYTRTSYPSYSSNCNFCSASCNPCDGSCPLPISYCHSYTPYTPYKTYTVYETSNNDGAVIGTAVPLAIIGVIILPMLVAFIFHYRRKWKESLVQQNQGFLNQENQEAEVINVADSATRKNPGAEVINATDSATRRNLGAEAIND